MGSVWEILGRKIQNLDQPIVNLQQQEQALHQEWQNLSQNRIRRLTGSMRRRVEAVIRARGGYTRY